MIDFHSHVLPSIDDGSGSVEESLELLTMLSRQGVDTVMATPHIDFGDNTPEAFLAKREESATRLSEFVTDGMPRILLGAEVTYFQGISRVSALADLRIVGTKLLLIEMPSERWSDYTVRELEELSFCSGIAPMIAHIERCMDYQKTKALQKLTDCGIIMQANASFFNDLRTRRRALKLLQHGAVHVIGSDCHSVKHRPPHIGEAADIITERLGADFLKGMNSFSKKLIGHL